MIEIKQINPSLITQISTLFNSYRVFYGQKPEIDQCQKFIQERFEKKDSIILVSMDGEIATGFTQLYPSFSSVGLKPILILNDLFVSKDHRKKGIAEALMLEAEKFAREYGAARIELGTQKTNFAAQNLYKKLNYKIDEEFYHLELNLN